MTKPSIRRDQVAGMNIHYINYSFDYFLDAQERIGFKTIELWCSSPHVWLDHMSYYDAKKIAKKIAEHGLKVHVLTPENCVYPYQYSAKEPEHVERTYGYFSNGIRLAEELGCDSMEVNSGWGYWNEDKDEAWKRSRDMLSRLAEFAGEHGVTLAMEALRREESQLVINIPTAQRMIEEVGSAHLKPMIDTCAMGVAGETIDQWFEAFDGDIRNVHFVDGTPYGHLIWGDGNHHLGEFIAALNRHGYDRYLGQEITDEGYFTDPAKYDLRNMRNFERYIED